MKNIQKFFLSFLLTMNLITISPLNAGWFLAWITNTDSQKLIEACTTNETASVRHLLSKRFIDLNAENKYGDTALHRAVSNGYQEIVTLLITAGASVNHPNKNGWTALMSAASEGHTDIATLLLTHGASVNYPNKNGWTALMSAAKAGHTDIATLLLTHGAEVNKKSKVGVTALETSAENGHLEMVRMLLAAGAEISGTHALMRAAQKGHAHVVDELIAAGATVAADNSNGWYLFLPDRDQTIANKLRAIGAPGELSALMLAIHRGDLDATKALIESGVDINRRDQDGTTPLMLAVRQKHIHLVQYLLSLSNIRVNARPFHMDHTALMTAAWHGPADLVEMLIAADATINLQNSFGDTALTITISFHDTEPMEIAQLLIAAGARLDTPSYTPLACAVQRNNSALIELLIAAGSDINHTYGFDGQTPLINAVQARRSLIVRQLLDTPGIMVDRPNKYGITALIVAATLGHKEIVKMLIEANADTNFNAELHSSSFGFESYCATALMNAAQKGDIEIVHMLLGAGALTDIKSRWGRTALMYAVEKNHIDVVQACINADADLDIQNNDGSTALMLAVKKNNLESVRLLVKNYADRTLVNERGQTALAIATSTPGICYEIVEILESCIHGGEGEEEEIMVKPAV